MLFVKRNPQPIRESVVERIACKFLFEQKNTAAIDLFNLNLTLFPQSPIGYYNLGQAFLALGNISQSIVNFTKYLELEPGDNEVVRKLDKIRGH